MGSIKKFSSLVLVLLLVFQSVSAQIAFAGPAPQSSLPSSVTSGWNGGYVGQDFESIAYGEEIFVAVGENGEIRSSENGETWVTRYDGSSTGSELYDVIYTAAGEFIAVGTWYDKGAGYGYPLILKSSDGISWTKIVSDKSGAELYSITQIPVGAKEHAGRLVAVGYDGVILLSDDYGATWSEPTSAPSTYDNFNTVAYGEIEGTRVLVAMGSDELVARSTDDGATWSTANVTLPSVFGYEEFDFESVTFANGQFVAVGGWWEYDDVPIIYTSADGIAWTKQTLPNSFDVNGGWLNSVIYDTTLNKFFVFGRNYYHEGGAILVSTDGVAWTELYSDNTGDSSFLDGVFVNGEFFISGRYNSTHSVMYTAMLGPENDYTNLTRSYVNTHYKAVAHVAGETFVAVGENGLISTSTDGGNNWVNRVSPQYDGNNLNYIDVAYNNGMYVAIANLPNGYAIAVTSTDGINWTYNPDKSIIDFGEGGRVNGIVFANTFVLYGNNGKGFYLQNDTWVAQPIGEYSAVDLVQYTANGAGLVFRNTDYKYLLGLPAQNLTDFYVVNSDTLTAITSNGTIHVAVGHSGVVYVYDSTESTPQWTKLAEPITEEDLLDVTVGNGIFVAVGLSGTIYASVDGTTWESIVSNATTNLNSITFGDSRFVTVGDGESIRYSAQLTYQVTYDANGATGTVPTDSGNYTSGDTVTVLNYNENEEEPLEKEGYTFDGWNTKADGSGNAYAADTTFAMPSKDVTLYAQWDDGGEKSSDTSLKTSSLFTIVDDKIKLHWSVGSVMDVIYNPEWSYNFNRIEVTDSKAKTSVEDSAGYTKQYGDLAAGDKLVVTAEDGTVKKYTVEFFDETAADSYNTQQNTALTTTASNGVLANDKLTGMGDASKFKAKVVADSAHGTVTLNDDGSFTYTPTASYTGQDTFTYHIEYAKLNLASKPSKPKLVASTNSSYLIARLPDPVVTSKTVIVTINVTGNSSSGSSTSNEEQIVVDVETGNNAGNGDVLAQTIIKRTTLSDGTKKDKVTFTSDSAQKTMDQLNGQQDSNKLARIVIPDPTDIVSQLDVDVPSSALRTVETGNADLEIFTNNVRVIIPNASLQGFNGDLYFNFIPIKKEEQQLQAQERAQQEEIVKQQVDSDTVRVIGRPMTIETNMQEREVKLVMPLFNSLPTDSAERQDVLDNLGIYIEHSDGSKEFLRGKVVKYLGTDGSEELGLEFTVSKFSTFTLVYAKDLTTHKPYINGDNGLFYPEKSVTRQQMAAMLARNLGYTNASNVSITYKDTAKSWAKKEIEYAKELGIMQGTSATEFAPKQFITRAQMATIAMRWIDKQCAENPNNQYCTENVSYKGYTDVTKSHWAADAIERISRTGLMKGFADGTFGPNKQLTRAQATKVLNKLFERGPLNGVTNPTFPDVPSTHWAFKDIEEAANTHSFEVLENGEEQLLP